MSFRLHPGEVLALAGDNGAGKSTLIKCISGVHHPDEGEIRYKGAPVRLDNPREARDLGIETIYQDLALADNLDVGANVFLGREPATRRLASCRRSTAGGCAQAASEVLENPRDRDPPNQAHLAGAHALGRPAPGGRDRPGDLLAGRGPDHGRADRGPRRPRTAQGPRADPGKLKEQRVGVIFISHNLVDIFAVADRILVLRRGIAAGERRTLRPTTTRS